MLPVATVQRATAARERWALQGCNGASSLVFRSIHTFRLLPLQLCNSPYVRLNEYQDIKRLDGSRPLNGLNPYSTADQAGKVCLFDRLNVCGIRSSCCCQRISGFPNSNPGSIGRRHAKHRCLAEKSRGPQAALHKVHL